MQMPNPRNLNTVLGAVGTELKNLGQQWKQKIPPITCLVVNQHDKTPQRGIEFHMPLEAFKKLPNTAQREVILFLTQDIWNYTRWDKVLRHFKLDPIVPAKSPILQEIANQIKYGRAGGETEDHRRLKEYVKANPELVGLPRSLRGEVEHMFLSNDELDVLFKCPNTWVGVEVKGLRSDSDDMMRGLFQCVKYKSLMEATQKYEQVELNSRVVLVLGGSLPPKLRELAELLEIEFRENVKIPSNFKLD
jgi:hypothetical protein